MAFDLKYINTPCYIVDEKKLIHNLEILKRVEEEAGCSILLAQKAFSMFSVYPLLGQYISGTAASGLYEAKLGHEYMNKENHIFSPAYKEEEFDEILNICDHIIFNSFSQWAKFTSRALRSNKQFGIRINPEYSTQDHAIYDPCSPFSRLGVTKDNFQEELLEGISGLHFHTLCEQNSDALINTVKSVEENFGKYLNRMKWVNFGGGHHITREDYDVEGLISCIKDFKSKYNIKVYLEPGEAIALNCGYLAAKVIDIVHNRMDIAILDTSAACHMPDVLEMPYRPNVIGSGKPYEKKNTYRFAGPTCLAGDVIGDYSFDEKLEVNDVVFFCDMAIYTMVKNNTFNGMALPSIYLSHYDSELELIKKFSYDDFKNRLS